MHDNTQLQVKTMREFKTEPNEKLKTGIMPPWAYKELWTQPA